MQPIVEIAARLGLQPNELEQYGTYKAKVVPGALVRRRDRPPGRLILVTAINPTPAGEGKTTLAIGLGDAMNRSGRRTAVCLRQPSMGPVFGMKGGATGGGAARVLPDTDINLHFTGDFHAVAAAHNLLAAAVDNHLQQGNALGIEPRRIQWPRTLDMNDRALRHIVLGLGGKAEGVPREGQFIITPASEVMAVLGLAHDLDDLKARLGRMVVASTADGRLIRCQDLQVAGAMAALLRDAVQPNLVQTAAGNPVFVHGGPFGNIAHGTSSVRATRLALRLADYVVQEAGFGADLGAEKFLNIFCRNAGVWPAAAVLVATVRALKYNGGQPVTQLGQEDVAALERGLPNLDRHLDNLMAGFGLPVVVAINRFGSDTATELSVLADHVHARGAAVALTDVYTHGGAGAAELADQVATAADAGPAAPRHSYDLADPLRVKVEKVAMGVYGAAGVSFTRTAETALRQAERHGFGDLPVCMAKTQYSLSDDPRLLGRPQGFTLTVRDLYPSAGAGFVVALTGDIMTMPGLPKEPAYQRIDVTPEGTITGMG